MKEENDDSLELDIYEENDFEEVSDEKLEGAFTSDDFKAYLREINRYPLLSYDETIRYYEMMKNGDNSAREKLIQSNLRLVLSVAFKYRYRLKNMNILDIIQEGNIGLMKGVDLFDPSKGALSNICVWRIRQAIGRAISDKDDTIRKPVNLQTYINKYNRLIDKARNDGITVTDDYVCAELKIGYDTLENIRYAKNQTVTSFNKKIDSDSDSNELQYFIADEKDNYKSVEDTIVTNELVAVLKTILRPNEYYLISERILFSNKTLEEVGNEFYITRESIRQKEESLCNRIRPYMLPNSSLFLRVLNDLRNNNPHFIENIKYEPISPTDIIKYLFIRDNLTDIEKKLYEFKFLNDRKYSAHELCLLLNISNSEYQSIITGLAYKINDCFGNKMSKFESFKSNLLKSYGFNVYECLNEFRVVDYDHVSNYFKNMSYDEFMLSYNDLYDELNDREKKLIERFFMRYESYSLSDYNVNKDVNLLVKNYKTRNYFLPKKVLLKTFKDNREYFTLQQQLFLECFLFSIKDKSEYYETYGIPKYRIDMKYFIDKLEKIHYGILGILENSFDLKKYLSVKRKYANKLGTERIKILDMYYGVNGVFDLTDIANEFGITYLEAHSKLRKSREYAISLYIDHSASINLLNKKNYLYYLKNKAFELSDDNREIVRLFIEDEMSYAEIASRFGLNNYKVSNVITDVIRKIDMYRLGILEFYPYTVSEIQDICNFYDWNKKNIKIICDRYKYGMSTDDLSIKYGMSKKDINNIVGLFNKASLKYKVKDVVLTKNDILFEINSHISESVISGIGKKCLAYYFGVECDLNPEGEMLCALDIGKKIGMSRNMVNHYIYDGERDIKLKKIGCLHADLCYFTREEMANLLKDVHLPISDKEKQLFCYLYELEGYPYKTLKQLEEVFGDSDKSLRRRFQRASLSIKKYLAGELKGQIHFETDIVPNLKYFDKYEKLFIIDHYRDSLTYQNIADKYSLTFNQVVALFDRINMEIYELINDPNYCSFDFDYAELVKNNKMLPFNGNLDVALYVYNNFFRIDSLNRKSITQIQKELELDCNTTAINTLLLNFMVAICKYREGIVNNIPYNYDDVLEFYSRKCDELAPYKKLCFEKFLNRNSKGRINSVGNFSDIILYELMLDRKECTFDVSTSTKSDVITILRKYGNKLSLSSKRSLYSKFGITERDLMNGKELNHVYRILDKLLKRKLELNNQTLVLEKKD